MRRLNVGALREGPPRSPEFPRLFANSGQAGGEEEVRKERKLSCGFPRMSRDSPAARRLVGRVIIIRSRENRSGKIGTNRLSLFLSCSTYSTDAAFLTRSSLLTSFYLVCCGLVFKSHALGSFRSPAALQVISQGETRKKGGGEKAERDTSPLCSVNSSR